MVMFGVVQWSRVVSGHRLERRKFMSELSLDALKSIKVEQKAADEPVRECKMHETH